MARTILVVDPTTGKAVPMPSGESAVDAGGNSVGGSGITNLALGTVTATTVPVESDTGTDVNLPLSTTALAGLQAPADKTKSDFISVTQAVDLDAMETATTDNATNITANDSDITDIRSAVGIADGATDMGPYTGGILTDGTNQAALNQELSDAIEAITADGNDTPVNRGNATAGVEPTAGEVPTPESGDTASVRLNDGTFEKWVHNGTSWSLAFTLAANEATDLGYTAAPTQGTVTSSTGTDSVITAVDGTNAGLMVPADKTKVDFVTVTQAVDLDELEAESANLVTLSGVASDAVNLGTFTGDTITDNVTNKVALQELETAVEAAAPKQSFTERFYIDGVNDLTAALAFDITTPVAGQVVSASIQMDAARTAGTLDAAVQKNGAVIGNTGLDLQINGTDPQKDFATVALGTAAFDVAAGDTIGFLVTNDAAYAPGATAGTLTITIQE